MDVKSLLKVSPWEWPSSATNTILATLTNKNEDEADRLIAAELGGELVAMNDDLAWALLNIVRDSSESADLRGTAAISLGPVLEEADMDGFDEPEEVPISEHVFASLMQSLRTVYFERGVPTEVRRRILESAVRAPQEWQFNEVKAAYENPDGEWKLTAVFAMGYLCGFDSQILESLKSDDPRIHMEAVKAAGNWELDGAWDHVLALLQDPATSRELRIAAIEAAASIRPKEAPEVLAEFTESEDEEIAEAAEEALLIDAELDDEAQEDDEPDDSEPANPKWIN